MSSRLGKIVPLDYAGQPVQFDREGWFNATASATRFGKKPIEWLRLPETERYVDALCRKFKVGKSHFVRTRRGGNTRQACNSGTWLHPKLGVPFARWLDIDFSIWCDEQIDNLLRGTHPQLDQERLRREAAASFRVMSEILRLTHELQGKAAESRHFINEARLVAWVLTGVFRSLDRSALSSEDLALLVQVEERNAVLLGAGLDYAERKCALEVFATEHRAFTLAGPARLEVAA
ncbi:KilA-N domain-containing protein [Aromatoleum anaerobium]|uniref:KilA-N domain-containing protein n=1 Tax=Aromatoleum anaerobium TaxID=182180 RepID=A0ABX1PTG0_9RHOO|nr:KilA-N domain-containing protein [Aromatoleum anaerobium]MCK0508482.1 KilA-N domain-containing protein [Aromatoleum anaerobium]